MGAIAARWGVIPQEASKTTWCELPTNLNSASDHAGSPQVAKAEALLALYCHQGGVGPRRNERLAVAIAEEVAINMIADLLHWLRTHGRDPDEALDRAQTRYEAELSRRAAQR
ncbi:hypothetical protein [Streptomyces paludis]|uniref:hypothetical protein n=1 Tax=Streptomyces paludis TaxID=2282738 RepID=UPI002F4111D9